VLPLDPRSLPPQAVLLWNRVPVQSFRPAEVSRYWFKDPALPLALAPAVRFSFSGLHRLPVKVAETSSRRASPSFRVSPNYTYPTHRNGSGPLMGFCSLQHMRDRRSTSRGFCPPATVRLQGLATLLTASALRSLAGFISHRQRSWDSPFGGFPSRKVSRAFPHGRTHIPLA
jgi:hypothetical protein